MIDTPLFSESWVEQRKARRVAVRLAVRVETCLRHSPADCDREDSPEDRIGDAIIDDLSVGGAAISGIANLHAENIVRLRFLLLGWRAAEVRWTRDGRAGCRLLTPLHEDELRAAIAESPTIGSNFPGLTPVTGAHMPAGFCYAASSGRYGASKRGLLLLDPILILLIAAAATILWTLTLTVRL